MPFSNRARIKLLLVPALLILGFFAWGPIMDAVLHNGIHGYFIDGVYIAETGKLWFQTDGSFYYASRVDTPGSISITTKSLFNKLYTYEYDPVAKKIVQETLQKYDKAPPQPKLFHVPAGILAVTTSLNREADLELRDPKTFAVTRDLHGFQTKFPELASGIADLYISDNADEPVFLRIKTRDGRSVQYDAESDSVFSSPSAYNSALKAAAPKTVTRYALGSDDARLGLYKLTGPSSELIHENVRNVYDSDAVAFHYKSEVVHLVPDQVFLEGLIVYEGDQGVVVISQNQIGKNADRLLSAVSPDGRLLWTAPQSQLFPELALRNSDDDIDTFFLKGKLHASAEGGLLILKMDNVGIQAFDLKTGEKKWEFRKP